MKAKLVYLPFLLLLLLLLPVLSYAEPNAGNWELSLSGSGSNEHKFERGSASVNLSLGYFLLQPLEIAVRQTGTYTDLGPGSPSGRGPLWTGSTKGAVDFHFPLGRVWPFIGGNVGASYGNKGTRNIWALGPEAGLKFFVLEKAFILAMAEYQFNIGQKNTDIGTNFKNGQFVYTLGVGFLF